MAQNSADAEDFVFAGLFTLAAGVTLGFAQVTIFNTSFSDTIFTVGSGNSITIATVISLAIMGIVYATNDHDLDSVDDFYYYSLVATVGLIVAIPMVPAVESFVTSSDFIAAGTAAIMSVGYGTVSYMA